MYAPITVDLTVEMASLGYWPARAVQLFAEGKYSSVVSLCRDRLPDFPNILSARLVYGKALYFSGQHESAAEQFHNALSLDPDNLVALKYLGDIKYALGDEFSALANYSRILEIDPWSHGLASPYTPERRESTTITLLRGAESAETQPTATTRPIPFYTETMGDLYLAQGYPRLALMVYRVLMSRSAHPRIAEKLQRAEDKLKERKISDHAHYSN